MTTTKTLQEERHKTAVRTWADGVAPQREKWIKRNRFFYEEDARMMRFLVPEGLTVLELGCGTGNLLAALRPSYGVGVDLSPRMIEEAKKLHPQLQFVEGDVEDSAIIASLRGPFDVIVLSDVLAHFADIQKTLDGLHSVCGPKTRIVIAYHSHLWEPVLRLGEIVGRRMPGRDENWLRVADVEALLRLSRFEPLNHQRKQLLPMRLLGIGRLVNRFVAPLPGFRALALRHYVVARPAPGSPSSPEPVDMPSASVLIPCRNERGNVEAAVERIPAFCDNLEIVFVEGHSQDGTWEEILRVKEAYPHLDIKAVQQPGKGKGDAMRTAYDVARGEVLMILDGDLTVPPEDLPKFYEALARNTGEFINGTRLVYPVPGTAMRFLNYWANEVFAKIFSYLLNQPFTDTLCGTKALTRHHYHAIEANQAYFGDFDPFGDFDLIFGAAKLNLRVQEVPIRYASREYGETQINRFQHGWLLLRMVLFALRRVKMI